MFPIRLTYLAVASFCILLATPAIVCAAEHNEVSGKVTLDGKPLATGKITLHQDSGQFVGCKIKDGKFQIDGVFKGRMKVTIEGRDVPAKYASEDASALIVEIDQGQYTIDFALQGEAKN